MKKRKRQQKNQAPGSAGGEKIVVEIRAAEGGDDAKLLVDEQFAIYAKLAVRERL